jgi:hypothetical protein
LVFLLSCWPLSLLLCLLTNYFSLMTLNKADEGSTC